MSEREGCVERETQIPENQLRFNYMELEINFIGFMFHCSRHHFFYRLTALFN